jgi:hypothetical protein
MRSISQTYRPPKTSSGGVSDLIEYKLSDPNPLITYKLEDLFFNLIVKFD